VGNPAEPRGGATGCSPAWTTGLLWGRMGGGHADLCLGAHGGDTTTPDLEAGTLLEPGVGQRALAPAGGVEKAVAAFGRVVRWVVEGRGGAATKGAAASAPQNQTSPRASKDGLLCTPEVLASQGAKGDSPTTSAWPSLGTTIPVRALYNMAKHGSPELGGVQGRPLWRWEPPRGLQIARPKAGGKGQNANHPPTCWDTFARGWLAGEGRAEEGAGRRYGGRWRSSRSGRARELRRLFAFQVPDGEGAGPSVALGQAGASGGKGWSAGRGALQARRRQPWGGGPSGSGLARRGCGRFLGVGPRRRPRDRDGEGEAGRSEAPAALRDAPVWPAVRAGLSEDRGQQLEPRLKAGRCRRAAPLCRRSGRAAGFRRSLLKWRHG